MKSLSKDMNGKDDLVTQKRYVAKALHGRKAFFYFVLLLFESGRLSKHTVTFVCALSRWRIHALRKLLESN